MHYETPARFVFWITVLGGIPLLFLVNIVGFKHLCGVSGIVKTDRGDANVQCKCIGYKTYETLDVPNNSAKTYCTGLDFSNNDLNHIIRISKPGNAEFEMINAQ